MSLLDNFNELCESQNNNIETKIHRFVLNDKYPIIADESKLLEAYMPIDMEMVEKSISISDILAPGRVYIIPISANNYFKSSFDPDIYENSVFCNIGSKEDGMESITDKEWSIYVSSYERLYGADLTKKLKDNIMNCIFYGHRYYDNHNVISSSVDFKPSYVYINNQPVTISNPTTILNPSSNHWFSYHIL